MFILKEAVRIMINSRSRSVGVSFKMQYEIEYKLRE